MDSIKKFFSDIHFYKPHVLQYVDTLKSWACPVSKYQWLKSRALEARALKRSFTLSGSTGVGLELVRFSALDPLLGQEKWHRLAVGRFGFIALDLILGLFLCDIQKIFR